MKTQCSSLAGLWKDNRFSHKTVSKIPRPVFLSLLFCTVYLSVASLTIPLTCKEVPACGSETKKGDIMIRPFIAQSGAHTCPMTGIPSFSPFVPITENLRVALEASNFDKSAVFADLGSSDKAKWQILITLRTTCDEICDEDGLPTRLTFVATSLSQFDIIRVNSSGVPGFAILLKNMPVSDIPANKRKNYEGSIKILEPCQDHASCDCNPTTKRKFRGFYEGGISVTNVEVNTEMRVQLIGGQGPQPESCDNCQ